MKLFTGAVALVALTIAFPTLANDTSWDRQSAESRTRESTPAASSNAVQNASETKKVPGVCECALNRDRGQKAGDAHEMRTGT